MLASKEREASAELVAHLAALDSRPALYAAQGYGSLFTYCTQALRLSEDAACNRIAAAPACRRFPVILDLLASGSLTLTSVRLLARRLTAENHDSVLGRARDRGRYEIEALMAELEVKSAVWRRDGGHCPFVSPTGRRCTERTFLDFHHIQPYAMQGPATVANISLRCWRHNQYEAQLIFGSHGPSIVRETR